MPLAGFLKRVNPRHGTPGPAIWATVGASMAAMAWSGIVPIVTSLSTVALYLAYVIPIVLGYRARKKWAGMAVWSLGKWGPLVNVVAIGYGAAACIILVMPPNELAGKTLAGVLLGLTAIYLAWCGGCLRGRSGWGGGSILLSRYDQDEVFSRNPQNRLRLLLNGFAVLRVVVPEGFKKKGAF